MASSSALILHNRPSNLPAKSQDEEQKHRQEYQQMVEAARKKGVLLSFRLAEADVVFPVKGSRLVVMDPYGLNVTLCRKLNGGK